MSSRKYCLITPCRDEARHARRTLDAVARQTELPALWVIVDDGSKDATPQILAEYAARFPWIRIVTRADRGHRKVGGGVIDAFYAGLETVDLAAEVAREMTAGTLTWKQYGGVHPAPFGNAICARMKNYRLWSGCRCPRVWLRVFTK